VKTAKTEKFAFDSKVGSLGKEAVKREAATAESEKAAEPEHKKEETTLKEKEKEKSSLM